MSDSQNMSDEVRARLQEHMCLALGNVPAADDHADTPCDLHIDRILHAHPPAHNLNIHQLRISFTYCNHLLIITDVYAKEKKLRAKVVMTFIKASDSVSYRIICITSNRRRG